MKFKVPQPAEKQQETTSSVELVYPTHVYLPVSAEMVQAHKVGQEVEIVVRGVVTSLETRQSPKKERSELQIRLLEVEAPKAKGKFAKLVEEGE